MRHSRRRVLLTALVASTIGVGAAVAVAEGPHPNFPADLKVTVRWNSHGVVVRKQTYTVHCAVNTALNRPARMCRAISVDPAFMVQWARAEGPCVSPRPQVTVNGTRNGKAVHLAFTACVGKQFITARRWAWYLGSLPPAR